MDLAKQRASNVIKDAVEEAQAAGMSVKEYIEQSSLCWQESLDDEKLVARKQFEKALK